MTATCDEGCALSFQQQSLVQQGYEEYTAKELRQLDWGLRFTPTVCALIALYGLVTHQPYVLFAVAFLGLWAFLAPAHHPMDLLYNHAVAPLFGARSLPPNPLQRRLACLSAALMNTAAGVAFLLGSVTAAYVIGGMLLLFQAIVIFTHFCVLSWVYELAARTLGSWQAPLEPGEARDLHAAGAAVIDVRTPTEYAEDHLEGATNVPLDSLSERLGELPEGTLLLYCRSGMRSNAAIQELKDHGRQEVHNLGGLDRARQVLAG